MLQFWKWWHLDCWTWRDVLMLGNVASRWRGWLLNEGVPETEHQGCVLHTADLALCTVWLKKCEILCLKLLNHHGGGVDFFLIRLYDVLVRSLKFVETLTLSESLLIWRSCCFAVRYSINRPPPVIYWNIVVAAQTVWYWLQAGRPRDRGFSFSGRAQRLFWCPTRPE
jgi:hypothetical protein